jgi:hypothetical protein
VSRARRGRRGPGSAVRKLLVVLGLVLAIFVAFDFGLRAFAQYWVGRELKEGLLLEERPGVSLGGFPFLFHLVSGSFAEVDVEARGYEDGNVRLDRVELKMRDVSIPRGQLLSGRSGRIRAGTGTGRAYLTGDDVTLIAQNQGVPVVIRFQRNRALVGAETIEGEVEAQISLSGQAVRLESDELPPGFAVEFELPRIVDGLRYTDVRVQGALLVIEFEMTDVAFEVPG